MINEAAEPLKPSNALPCFAEKGFALDRGIFSRLRRESCAGSHQMTPFHLSRCSPRKLLNSCLRFK